MQELSKDKLFVTKMPLKLKKDIISASMEFN